MNRSKEKKNINTSITYSNNPIQIKNYNSSINNFNKNLQINNINLSNNTSNTNQTIYLEKENNFLNTNKKSDVYFNLPTIKSFDSIGIKSPRKIKSLYNAKFTKNTKSNNNTLNINNFPNFEENIHTKNVKIKKFNENKKTNLNKSSPITRKHLNPIPNTTITQKNFDFKTILDNEKIEEEKRLFLFFQKFNHNSDKNSSLNSTSINNNSNAKNKNSFNMTYLINNPNNSPNFCYNYDVDNNTTKNYFDVVRPKMLGFSAENILNSFDTIKNRNKLVIRNTKLKIKNEVPKTSYLLTNIKPLRLFDFNNKLKGSVNIKKNIEELILKNSKKSQKNFFDNEENHHNEIDHNSNRIILDFLKKENKKKSLSQNFNNYPASSIINETDKSDKSSDKTLSMDSSYEQGNQNIKDKYTKNTDNINNQSSDNSSIDYFTGKKEKSKFIERNVNLFNKNINENKNEKPTKIKTKIYKKAETILSVQPKNKNDILVSFNSSLDQSEDDSVIESVNELDDNLIHNLDDSGILQLKRHESLYVKAKRKISQSSSGIYNNLSSKSPAKFKKSENSDFVSPPFILNSIKHSVISPNKTVISIDASNINCNKNPSFNKEGINPNDLDFEMKEAEHNFKTNSEINKIKNELNNLRKSRFDFKSNYLNDIHKKLEKKAFEINPDYQNTKDVYAKYQQDKIIDKKDFRLSSRLYMMNRNPIFQINNMISFPNMINDPIFLANIYNVNMFKIESSTNKKIK